ncbi:MAG: TetR/AcrR family transcriptional regulator [Candidatus Heimdallarchaeota archaeon]
MSADEPTKMKKEQRRESILETALGLFVEKGFEATTMREIAKAEGISETLLYRFFSKKQDVLLGILQTRFLISIKSLEELLEATRGMMPDPKVTLPIIMKLAKNRMTEHRDLFTLFQKERKYIRECFNEMRQTGTLSMLDIGSHVMGQIQNLGIVDTFTDYLRRSQQANNIRKDIDPEDLAKVLLRLFSAKPFPNLKLGGSPDDYFSEEDLDKQFELQLKIILDGILPRDK